MRAGNRHAAQRVAKKRTGGDHLTVVVKATGGIGEVLVARNAFLREQRVHLRLPALVARRNGADEIIAHGILRTDSVFFPIIT